MLRTFNCGIGMIVVVSPADVERVRKHLGEEAREIGAIVARKRGEPVRYQARLPGAQGDEEARRRPDLGPGLEPPGPDRRRKAPDYPAKIVARDFERAGRARPAARRGRFHSGA